MCLIPINPWVSITKSQVADRLLSGDQAPRLQSCTWKAWPVYHFLFSVFHFLFSVFCILEIGFQIWWPGLQSCTWKAWKAVCRDSTAQALKTHPHFFPVGHIFFLTKKHSNIKHLQLHIRRIDLNWKYSQALKAAAGPRTLFSGLTEETLHSAVFEETLHCAGSQVSKLLHAQPHFLKRHQLAEVWTFISLKFYVFRFYFWRNKNNVCLQILLPHWHVFSLCIFVITFPRILQQNYALY